MTTPDYNAERERNILRGLVWEWECAMGEMPSLYRHHMKLPNFEIRDVSSVWGMWMPGSKTIVLSLSLVRDYSWFSVREVLRHEMAHQFVDEVMGGRDKPHGEMFHKACEMLRADPKASADPSTSEGENPSIRERILSGDDGDKDRISSRIDKLRAMGASNSPHEAETATRIAEELQQKYNVSHVGSGEPGKYFSMFIGKASARFTTDQYALLRLLRDVYLVRTVTLSVFNPEEGRPQRAFEISGRIENLRMADYVYNFLTRIVEEEWLAFNRGKTFSRYARIDFAQGLIRGVRERLAAAAERVMSANSETKALVTRMTSELDAYITQRFPRLRWTSRRGRRVNEDVQRAGEAVGQKTVIFKAIESKTERRGFLLPA